MQAVPAKFAVGGLVAVVATIAACAPVEPAYLDSPGVRRFGVTVSSVGGCSTAAVAGLSAQLIAEQNCLRPGVLQSFAGTPNLVVPSYVNAMLEPPAVVALQTAAAAASEPIEINSAFRTLAQQYLLKKWEGTCGITIAATPGSSNHETGLALDVDNHAAVQAALESAGWKWFGAGDAVHFDYQGAGTVDLRDDSVLGFQRLWNRNHPEDTVTLDGSYGPQTASRLGQSPAEGFPIGAECDPATDLGAPADLAMRSDLLTTAADLATRDDLAPSNAPPDLAPAIVEGRTVYGGCDLAASSRAVSLTSLAWTALALWLARRRLRAQ